MKFDQSWIMNVACEWMIVPVYENERPLASPTADIDWVFGRSLSYPIQLEVFKGEPGECLIVPLTSRQGSADQHVKKVLLIGGGTEPVGRLPAASEKILLKNLASLSIKRACSLPGAFSEATLKKWQDRLPGSQFEILKGRAV